MIKLEWDEWAGLAILAILFVFFIWLCIMVVIDLREPTFSLKKDEWSCSISHEETHLRPRGKLLMPVIETVCTRWDKLP